MNSVGHQAPPPSGGLQRRLSLTLLVLYGLGVTVGAGIYVLIGATAERAGLYAPISFLVAALVVAFTGFSYAELSTRFPVSAGEAAYVRNGLNSRRLSLLVGLLVATSGIVSAATVSIGAAGYIGELISIEPALLIISIVLIMTSISVWGILESVSIAAVLTIIEIAGLGLVVAFGSQLAPDIVSRLPDLIPPFEITSWAGIGSASILAFYAFVGFEDLANVAEEAIAPRVNMPRAIILTLIITTLIYLTVVSVVVLAVPMTELAASTAPLTLVFNDTSPAVRSLFNLVAIIATLNGVLIQMIMASRVIYGLASNGQLPPRLAFIAPRTRTPVMATALVGTIVLVLALLLPMERLAEATSSIALGVFTLVNLALLNLKRRGSTTQIDAYEVHISIPIIGCITSALLLLIGIL